MDFEVVNRNTKSESFMEIIREKTKDLSILRELLEKQTGKKFKIEFEEKSKEEFTATFKGITPFNADEITIDNFEGIIKCRKKPFIIHALKMNFPEGFEVTTMEGKVRGKQGDYLMFGVNGEKYPCNKEIFEKSYDYWV